MQYYPADDIAYAIMSAGWYCIADIIACGTGLADSAYQTGLTSSAKWAGFPDDVVV